MVVNLTPTQEQNLRAALSVTDDPARRVRLVFAIWTESKAQIYANGGLNTSKSPGFDEHPEWPATLRRSLQIPHDEIGNNGRSTGMLQQISAEVGGTWGPMVGTMDPVTSAKQFLAHLRVTDNPIFTGRLQTSTGVEKVNVLLSSPIAADVLRVQQPLASEARSSNYNADQVAIAQAIVAQLTNLEEDWLEMVTREEYVEVNKNLASDLAPKVITFYDQLGGSHFVAYPNGTYTQVPNPMGDDGVLASHLGHLEKMGVKVIDIGKSDPFMFGHRIEWSDRPASTTEY